MLIITIPAIEVYDERTNEFRSMKEQTLQLEHSLIAISKWEMKWMKPFLTKYNKTTEEIIYYIRCMTITPNIKPGIYSHIPGFLIDQINEYINSPMTATWINDKDGKSSNEVVTSELIYYWMIGHSIPMECQKWHLNRLLMLIRVCNSKNQPTPKVNKKETLMDRTALNNARRAQLNTKG